MSSELLTSGEPFAAVGRRTDVRLLSFVSSQVVVQVLSGPAFEAAVIEITLILFGVFGNGVTVELFLRYELVFALMADKHSPLVVH